MPRYSFNEKDFEGGGMYNGYYEVFFKHSKPATYSIRRIDEADIHGKKMLLVIAWSIIAAIIVPICTFVSTKRIK